MRFYTRVLRHVRMYVCTIFSPLPYSSHSVRLPCQTTWPGNGLRGGRYTVDTGFLPQDRPHLTLHPPLPLLTSRSLPLPLHRSPFCISLPHHLPLSPRFYSFLSSCLYSFPVSLFSISCHYPFSLSLPLIPSYFPLPLDVTLFSSPSPNLSPSSLPFLYLSFFFSPSPLSHHCATSPLLISTLRRPSSPFPTPSPFLYPLPLHSPFTPPPIANQDGRDKSLGRSVAVYWSFSCSPQ